MSEREVEKEGASAQSGGGMPHAAKQSSMEAFEEKVEELAQQQPAELADVLVKSALAGCIPSLKFLHRLLEKRNVVHKAERAKARPSIVDLWAAEPEWQDEDEVEMSDGAAKRLALTDGRIDAERG